MYMRMQHIHVLLTVALSISVAGFTDPRGMRQTQVENNNSSFTLPSKTLSHYLEGKEKL